MALDIKNVVVKQHAVQYDGTNGTEIVGMFSPTEAALVSDDGDTLELTLANGGLHRSMPLGSWLVWQANSVPDTTNATFFSDVDFQEVYVQVA